ncbi:MAG TPA: hypothetical protein DEO32_05335 [Ruminococcaceae bacterium]|nr:hypothetical protein [Oscillospiraceae bacterium]
MPALPESVFDILYLVFAAVSGIYLLSRAKGRRDIVLFGVMTLILGFGDAFHLVPRILNYWFSGNFTEALGIGKLVTSVTMTVFYLLFEYARRARYKITEQKPVIAAAWLLTAARIALCCFPQNEWTSANPSHEWGIIRNIPFAFLGLLTVIMWFKSAKTDKPLRLAWLAVTLSFLFYFPVVLLAHEIPLAGMLMLPKTCMYVWLIIMFRKVCKE